MAALKVLALEPWDAGSHRSVRESLTRHSRHEWTWLKRPGRGARWRLRYGAIDFAAEARELSKNGSVFDAVFVSGLCSLSDFRAAVNPGLRNVPYVLYMHENQAAYPVSEAVDRRTIDRDSHLAFTNLASIEGSDLVLWNSTYNRDSFVEEMTILMRRAPESVGNDWCTRLELKSEIAWPPVETDELVGSQVLHNTAKDRYSDNSESGRSRVRVAWPHRWEHDTGCDELLRLIETHRDDKEFDFQWVILGERYQRMPAAMHVILDQHADVLDHAHGDASRATYLQHLGSCDWVNSTALHEFFGIAVVEALLSGCLPWLPNRLSYPELLPPGCIELTPWNPPEDAAKMRRLIQEHLKPATSTYAVERIDDAIERGREGCA